MDVETTGGHPAWHRVTEIAIVAMTGGMVEWEWSSLVNPGCGIPPSIQALTGISPAMVADAPRFEELAAEVARRLAGRRFVAHNVRFDYGFVRAEMRRAGRDWSAPQACTVRLSRQLYADGGRHGLDAVVARHGLDCGTRHRALPDARVLALFWNVLRRDWPSDVLEAALEGTTRRPALPAHLPADLLDELPEAPGVYRFLGEGDALIYVGKSTNLRERVLSHFAGAGRDSKSQRLAAQTRRIDWTETAGELGALLLEARLVRELKPVYNRRLRGTAESLTWWVGDAPGAPRLVDLDADEPPADADLFGLYRSAKLARSALVGLAREQKLCLKVLGLEPAGAGSCFGLQVGRCNGACVGQEPAARHHLRLKLALAPLRMKPWPFRGPVAVEERGAGGFLQRHIIDRWQYLGTLTEGATAPELARPGRFDVDAYRILCRRIRPGMRGLQPFRPSESAWQEPA